MVSIPEAARRAQSYAHELSGGMRQRAMIAIALANDPDIVIADEPTTALDVTVQAQILDVLRSLQESRGLTVLLITHDLGVVAGLADVVHVMYAGELVESAPAVDAFHRPQHPYTSALLQSLPRLDRPERELMPIGGTPPALLHDPVGCAFAPRCRYAIDACERDAPVAARPGSDQCRVRRPADEAGARRRGLTVTERRRHRPVALGPRPRQGVRHAAHLVARPALDRAGGVRRVVRRPARRGAVDRR